MESQHEWGPFDTIESLRASQIINHQLRPFAKCTFTVPLLSGWNPVNECTWQVVVVRSSGIRVQRFPCHTGFLLSWCPWVLMDPCCCCGLKLPWGGLRLLCDLLWIFLWVVGLKVVGNTDTSQYVGEWDIHEECSPHPTVEHLTAVVRALQWFCQHLWVLELSKHRARTVSTFTWRA